MKCSLEIVVAYFWKKRKKITVPKAAEAIDYDSDLGLSDQELGSK